MWPIFTESGRRSIMFAQEEASRLGLNEVSTEHLLLGLLREEDSIGSQILSRHGATLASVRELVETLTGPAKDNVFIVRKFTLSASAKKAMEMTYEEAATLLSDSVGGEHILLGLLFTRDDITVRIFDIYGMDLDGVRREVKDLQNAHIESYGA